MIRSCLEVGRPTGCCQLILASLIAAVDGAINTLVVWTSGADRGESTNSGIDEDRSASKLKDLHWCNFVLFSGGTETGSTCMRESSSGFQRDVSHTVLLVSGWRVGGSQESSASCMISITAGATYTLPWTMGAAREGNLLPTTRPDRRLYQDRERA